LGTLTSIDGWADFPARGLNFMALPLSYSFRVSCVRRTSASRIVCVELFVGRIAGGTETNKCISMESCHS